MKSLFEEMGGTYHWEGDYLIPDLELPEQQDYTLGKYGRMHQAYLKEHHPVRYSCLLTQGQLWNHLLEIDRSCRKRMEVMVDAMKQQEGVTEALKTADQMEWVRRMNSIRNRAEESVLHELVYGG